MTKCPGSIVPGSRIAATKGLLLAVCLCFADPVYAQYATFEGTVVDSASGMPLQDAHVFIASSLLGTSSDAHGRFALSRVPPGSHRLMITMLGYTPAIRDTLIRADQRYEFSFSLPSKAVPLEEVVVNARQARRWQRRLLKFERLFLGETTNSSETTIVNPHVLSFKSRLGNLSASASAPLIIENRALGYRIRYYLKEFEHFGSTIKYDGDPSYTELEPADSAQAAFWEAGRRQAFLGSQRHFLLALIAQRTADEGFEVLRRSSFDRSAGRFRVDPGTLLEPGPTPLEHLLTFHGILEIVYTGEFETEAFRRWQRMAEWARPGPQRSFMELNHGPTLVDQNGEVIDPYGVVVYGYYAFERIADQAPKGYRPPEWTPR
ncbi:MAG: carboxypeptidase-like regulatory domain-containing protein [Bacteroidota bacterium]|nr:carboxypeptidase-like regulatory domain-containing protein [Bacteroidota bacterium]